MYEIEDLIYSAGVLTKDEEKSWQNFLNHRRTIRLNTEKEKLLENINQLSFLKRQVEKRLIKECEKLESIEHNIVLSAL